MAERLIRVDRDVASLSVYDNAEDRPLPTPGHASATYTSDGYLLADALIARDGLLLYGDGQETWLEYRPRSELVAAADSWAGTPVTAPHPEKMVTSETWQMLAKGVHLGTPKVIDVEGVAYLQASLLITAADLIKTVEKRRDAGKPVQLSIGFTTLVRPESGMFHGREYIAIQTILQGNHTAVVDEGRAGPSCRILFDGAAVTVSLGDSMSDTTNKKPKTDEEGAPTKMVEVTGPNGPEMVSTWIAAELEALQGLRASTQAPPAAPPAAPMVAPADAPPPPPAPRDPSAAPAPTAPEEEEDGNKKMDSKERRRLERAAEKLGADDEKLDSFDDAALKRFIISESTPISTETLSRVKGDSLDALVSDALKVESTATQEPTPKTPWGGQVGKADGAPQTSKPAPADAAVANFLRESGYEV